MTERRIDLYTHFLPPGYLERFEALARDRGMVRRIAGIPMLHDVEMRRRLVRRWSGYQQVLSPSPPGFETFAPPVEAAKLARFVNDGLAELCRSYPDEFPAFVAGLPLNDVDLAMAELDHAIAAGARGIQLYTNVLGRPLDAPEFAPILEAMANRYRLPVFLHPARPASFADYASESGSRFEIWQVLGWPYETAAAIARLVFSRTFDRLPSLQIVTHHLGGVIPYLEGRIGPLWDQLGSRTEGDEYERLLSSLDHRPIDYFRRIHADTAVGGSHGALRCGLDFFGDEWVLFASDCPLDPEGGKAFIRDGFAALDALDLPAAQRTRLLSSNALSLLHLNGN